MDNDHSNANLFSRLLGEDFEVLQGMFDALEQEIADISAQEKDLAERRSVLEVRRAIIANIGRLHQLERNARVHGHDRSDESNPSTPAAARTILDRNPAEAWDAQSMHEELRREGIDSTRENVRVALQRLVKTGQARRVGRGRYQSLLADPSTLLGDDEDQERDAREPLLR